MDDYRCSLDNPMRPVDARSRVAETLLRTVQFPSPRRYDPATCKIAAYLRLRRGSGQIPGRRNPIAPGYQNIHQAFELRETGEPQMCAAVEAMLLTDMKFDAIASQVGVEPACVAWYAAAFFDVRERLSASHFIVHQVIEEYRERSEDNWCHYGWKLVAYLGGRTALEETMGTAKVTNLQELIPLLRRETLLILQAKACRLASELSADGATALTNLLQVFEAKGQNFGEPVLNDYEENIKAMMEEIPWRIGAPKEEEAKTALTMFEGCAPELRAYEMMLVAHGVKLPYVEELLSKKLPPPRPTSETESNGSNC